MAPHLRSKPDRAASIVNQNRDDITPTARNSAYKFIHQVMQHSRTGWDGNINKHGARVAATKSSEKQPHHCEPIKAVLPIAAPQVFGILTSTKCPE